MAHRGRLNVLVNTLGKNPRKLFDEFEGKFEHAHDDRAHTGDVKYHMGFSADIAVGTDKQVHLALAFNPRTWKSSTRSWWEVCARVRNVSAMPNARPCCRS